MHPQETHLLSGEPCHLHLNVTVVRTHEGPQQPITAAVVRNLIVIVQTETHTGTGTGTETGIVIGDMGMIDVGIVMVGNIIGPGIQIEKAVGMITRGAARRAVGTKNLVLAEAEVEAEAEAEVGATAGARVCRYVVWALSIAQAHFEMGPRRKHLCRAIWPNYGIYMVMEAIQKETASVLTEGLGTVAVRM